MALEEAIKVYYEVTKSWLLQSAKKPLVSIFGDPDLNFDFMESNLDGPTETQDS